MSDRLAIIMTSGTREKLQMAAMTAAVAAAGGSEVLVFVSMNALLAFRRDQAPEAPPEGEVGRLLASKGAPRPTDLFRQAVELGSVKVFPCSMAMDVLALAPEALLDYLDKPTGLTKFLSELGAYPTLTF